MKRVSELLSHLSREGTPRRGIAQVGGVCCHSATQPLNTRSGFLLVTLLALTGLLSLLVLSMAALSLQESQAAQRQAAQVKAYYLAEGGVDTVVSQIRQGLCKEAWGSFGDREYANKDLEIPCDLSGYSTSLGTLTSLTWRRFDTLRRFTLTAETPAITDGFGRLLHPQGRQTLTAYIRDKIDPFIFDTLVYTPNLSIKRGASYTGWAGTFIGSDPDGEPTPGQPELDRGNIYTAKNKSDPSFAWGMMGPSLSPGAQFVSTRLIEDPAVFPVPLFRKEGSEKSTGYLARHQYQRDVTGVYLCKDASQPCNDDTNEAHVANRRTNYYDADRIAAVNRKEETLPSQFWYPEFQKETVPAVKNPLTGEIVIPEQTVYLPLPPTKPNVLVMEFSKNVSKVAATLDGIGGFLMLVPPNDTKDNKVTVTLSSPVTTYYADTAKMNAIVYNDNSQSEVNLWVSANADLEWDGAFWGGSSLTVSEGDVAERRFVYRTDYADAVKALEIPAEPQVLAVHASEP